MQRLAFSSSVVTLLMIHAAFEVKSQMINEYDAYMFTGFRDRNAFYALQSCHQILHGDMGEFFSPDYLCSNPALWCNWTIQVQKGKRVRLYLEDLTPAHACHLKTDQVHLDETPLSDGESRILERCWGSVVYTSASSMVHVVQLIEPNLNVPHRGFYGMYQAFGRPESPAGKSAEDLVEVMPLEKEDEVFSAERSLTEENVDVARVKPNIMNAVAVDRGSELPTDATGSLERNSGEIRKTRDESENLEGAVYGALNGSDHDFLGLVVEPTLDEYDQPSTSPDYATHTQSNNMVQTVLTQPSTTTATTNQKEAKLFRLQTTHTPDEPAGTLKSAPQDDEGFGQNKPNSTRNNKQSHRIKGKSRPVQRFRNTPEAPHLPGGLLLEVTVEVGLDRGRKANWDLMRNSYSAAVEAMIQKVLEGFNPQSVSSKRSKRLDAGAVFIVWVQFGDGDEGLADSLLQSIPQELKGKSIDPPDSKSHGIVMSVSVEDIDECETHLAECDVNARCVNDFGSYACRCRYGYSANQGGTTCAEPVSKRDDCSRTSLDTLLYIVCFLLFFLLTLLLVTMCVSYRRYHHGTFLPRCRYSRSTGFSANDVNNNTNSSGGDGGVESSSRQPPPPPPPLRLTGGAPELPLLRFSPLTSPEGKLQREKL